MTTKLDRLMDDLRPVLERHNVPAEIIEDLRGWLDDWWPDRDGAV